ncbi:hypothetical protein [Bradyrhizobium prioriisuperbiae]|uniref:hypothetical protein n=1 Tax=Bradyrhizobium prioriisuperbiae TaxID=2854389 RepID=UPI0028E90FD2|nr:hypothetical protein [Bradyrhizobium prioritasuperba]
MSNIVQFPSERVTTECSGCTMPGITQDHLRRNAWNNFYTECRHQQIDPLTSHELADAFMADIERRIMTAMKEPNHA